MDSIVNQLSEESNPDGRVGSVKATSVLCRPTQVYCDLSPDCYLAAAVSQSTWVLATLKGPTVQELERQQRRTTEFHGYEFESQHWQEFFTR